MTSFHAEKCCRLVSSHTTSDRSLYSRCREFLIYSSFGLVSWNVGVEAYWISNHMARRPIWRSTVAQHARMRNMQQSVLRHCESCTFNWLWDVKYTLSRFCPDDKYTRGGACV